MSLSALDNLVRVGQLKAEQRNESETKRMLAMARTRLADAQLAGQSPMGRFISAYNAGHVAALAALRWHGYRSENRYLVDLFTPTRLRQREVTNAPVLSAACCAVTVGDHSETE